MLINQSFLDSDFIELPRTNFRKGIESVYLEVIARSVDDSGVHVLCITHIVDEDGNHRCSYSKRTIAEQLEEFKDRKYDIYIGNSRDSLNDRPRLGDPSHLYLDVWLLETVEITYAHSELELIPERISNIENESVEITWSKIEWTTISKMHDSYVARGICPSCTKPVKRTDFRNDISKKEFERSGFCQKCQDSLFERMEMM